MCSLNGSKAFMAFCNFLLLISGCMLTTAGIFLIFDSERVLLSKLLSTESSDGMSNPVLYYVALGITTLGFGLIGVGMLGCWASCLHSYCFLVTYILIVMGLLVGECAVYSIMWVWPGCLGLELRADELVRSLRRSYGTAGKEQFSAALDLTQTMFSCCGVLTANEYDSSLWRLQELGPKLAVPLSCCILNNMHENKAYLDPQPLNITLCQALEESRHKGYRHTKGCIKYLEEWYMEHYLMFLLTGLVVVLMEFLALLSTVLAFTWLCKGRRCTNNPFKNIATTEPRTVENIYNGTPAPFRRDDCTFSRSFRQTYNISDNEKEE